VTARQAAWRERPRSANRHNGPSGSLYVAEMFILFRAIVYATLFVAFGLVFLPSWLLRDTGLTSPAVIGPAQVAGAAMVVAGGCLAGWSILAFVFVGKGTAAPFDPPRRLVGSGPFRYVRNPIYVGAVVAMAGAALSFHSWGLLAYDAAIAVTFHVLVRAYEEPVLRRTFGAEYDAYCARVARWPGLR
jgi:protein-S-isoprenylcysteine O-methyltransferase Ste14